MPKFTSQEIVARLKKIAGEQLNLKPEQLDQIQPGLPIVEGLQLDSLAQVTLIAAIEDDFGIELGMEDREQIQTIQDLVRMIQERTASSLPCN